MSRSSSRASSKPKGRSGVACPRSGEGTRRLREGPPLTESAPLRKLRAPACIALLAGCLHAAGCQTPVALEFPTASKLPEDERRPDGIAVDLSSAPPSPLAAAETERGVVSLRAPLGTAAAFATVREFFDGVVDEDITRISSVTTGGAVVNDTRGSSMRVHNLSFLWRQRFNKFDYRLLAGRLVYREADVRTYRAGSAATLPHDLRGVIDFAPGDVVLRVPIIGHTVRNEQLLGSELTFLLRRYDDRYVIERIAEDVPL